MTESTSRWGVIFDVDGTMVDNHGFHQQAWIELGKRHQLPIDAEYYKNNIHSRDNIVIIARMRELFPDAPITQEMADEKEAIYREVYREKVAEMPGLLRFLGELRQHSIPCVVASNAPDANARLVLNGLGVTDQFTAVLTPNDRLPGKPAPDLFLAAAAAMNLPPRRCVVFEDSYSGFLAAEAAEIPCVAILHGASSISLPYAEKARARYRDFTEITCEQLHKNVLRSN